MVSFMGSGGQVSRSHKVIWTPGGGILDPLGRMRRLYSYKLCLVLLTFFVTETGVFNRCLN